MIPGVARQPDGPRPADRASLDALRERAIDAAAERAGHGGARRARGRGPGQEGRADRDPARHRRAARRGPARRSARSPTRSGPAVEAALGDGPRERSAAPSSRRGSRPRRVDVTTPGRPIRRGSLHPIVETEREIARIFGQFGFVVYEGPEVENDATNFQMLNIPPDHPARDLWDTLYLDVEATALLRTHTSPGQIRVMHQERPPIRALLPGRCFRYEAVDASHGFEFFQVEGLMVDEGTTMADLKGLLDQFAHAMFGAGPADALPARLLPVHRAVGRVRHPVRHLRRRECPACSRTGWMTILGAGMVHPVVLRNGGIDPERYQGFAFGMGIDRIAILRHAVVDLRAFMENDLRFLERSDERPAVLAARVRRRRPDAGAARRAADAARAWRSRPSSAGAPTGSTSSWASCSRSRSTRTPTGCR